MRISLSWLKEYIDLPESPEDIADTLTATGLEVEKLERVEHIPGGLNGLIIGEVLTSVQHPNADKLKLCQVDLGNGQVSSIVCGAPNVKAGQKVIVAPVGITIYPVGQDPFKIKKAKIRGEQSEGMLCAEDEIGLGSSHDGIIVLDTDLPNGTAVRDLYQLEDDYSIEIGLTPNRGDATSHIGVARDLKAVYKRDLRWPDISTFRTGGHRFIDVEVLNPEACPRYSGITITDIKVEESPDWLKMRLQSIGLNPINNIVDITNFVLHETGQPLHAFDADEITGNKVIVKTMEKGSTFTTLDEIERKLSREDLMICNSAEGMCIAGVFGGLKSGIKEGTTSLFLESACFSPDFIRKTAQKHQLKTDASFRFERGTDPDITLYALKRATNLICEIAGGKVSSEIVDIYPEPVKPFRIEINYRNIDRLIGVKLERAKIHEILTLLDINQQDLDNDGFTAIVPPYRVDVTREADVIEEILRIYGFNNIELPESMGSEFLAEFPKKNPDDLKKVISDMLSGTGFYEIMTNSLTKPEYSELDDSDSSDNVKILNKLSEDLGVMRQSMLFGALEVAAYNVSHKQKNLKLFEFGKTYKYADKYVENRKLCLLLTGEFNPLNWNQKPVETSFYHLGSTINNLIGRLSEKSLDTAVIENKRYAYALQYSIDGKEVGTAGMLDAKICSALEIQQPVFYAELDWDVLLKKSQGKIQYSAVPKFPEVKRDLSLVIEKSVNFETVKTVALKNSNHLLKKLTVFDVYEGDKIGTDQKAYALSFVLQDNTKTLTDKIIDKTMIKLMGAFEKELGAHIRK